MSESKTPSVEELLARVAEGKKPRKKIETNSNVNRYIAEFKLEPGTLAVPSYVIYWHYRMIFEGARQHKANKIVFFRTFSKTFTQYRHGKQRFYLIAPGVLPTDEESLKAAETYEKTYAGMTKVSTKEKKKKKEATVVAPEGVISGEES